MVNLGDGKLKDGVIHHAGANTPGWISNLRITYAGGTFTITGVDDDLSPSNPGFITFNALNSTNNGILKITKNYSFNDDAHASSNLTNRGFGITETVNWSEDMPVFIYAALVPSASGITDADGTDGNSTLFISRLPWLRSTPTDVDEIGDLDTISTNDSQGSIMLLDDLTLANYTLKSVQLLGMFRWQWSTFTDDYTVSSLDFKKDGLGHDAIERGLSVNWIMPAGQNGADSGLYMISDASVAPSFTDTYYDYMLFRNANVQVSFYANGDGGTDGSGSVQTNIVTPIIGKATDQGISPQTSIGIARITSVATGTDPCFIRFGPNGNVFTFEQPNGSDSTLGDFTNGGRYISFLVTYRGKNDY